MNRLRTIRRVGQIALCMALAGCGGAAPSSFTGPPTTSTSTITTAVATRNATPTATAPTSPVDLGIFESVAGRIVYASNGIWGIDLTAPTDPATRVKLPSQSGVPLGWSSDGTRLLTVLHDRLIILHADGSETQITEGLAEIRDATIAPDGSRVVFAGGTGQLPGGDEGECCAQYGLFAVDAAGGPTRLLVDHGDEMEGTSFSPDGTRIAYIHGAGDNGHQVWVIDADGSDARQIPVDDAPLGSGHVRGLVWSPAGDRIALAIEGIIFSFPIEGGDLKQIAGDEGRCQSPESCAVNLPKMATRPYWSPDGSQIAYGTGCVNGSGVNREGCLLAIADADGSNALEFTYGAAGPWHPGAPAP